ncbi:MAG: GDP-mannose 4,6-dehydratase, partial [Ilumatobacteraceae bacterium]
LPYFTPPALQHRPLPMYATTHNRRAGIHPLDHCAAIDSVLHRGRVGETYHVGTGVEVSLEEMADAILAHLGKPASLKQIVPDRPGHDRRYLLDDSKIRHELGWKPLVDWQHGLASTIDWYAANRSWWQPLLGRAPVAESSAWNAT